MFPQVEVPTDIYKLSNEELLKLSELDASLSYWSKTKGPSEMAIITARRPVTPQELETIHQLIKSGKLIIVYGGGNFGFSLSVTFYKHPLLEQMNVGLTKPAYIVTLIARHFVGEGETYNPKKHMDAIWDEFNKEFYSDQNRQFLDFYGFDPPRGRSYYEF